MLCDNCNKNPATVHLTEIVDSQMNELHLCEECARQKSTQMESQFGLSELLAGLAEFGKPAGGKEKEQQVNLKCPVCGLTYADFKKIGRLGCGNCYEAFKKYLAVLLKRIHGSSQHVGKSPFKKTASLTMPVGSKTKPSGLEDLKIKLQRAIESEAFEEAAKIRDQIKALEDK